MYLLNGPSMECAFEKLDNLDRFEVILSLLASTTCGRDLQKEVHYLAKTDWCGAQQ